MKDDLISKTSVCEIIADIYPTDGEKVVAVKEIDKAYEAIQQLPPAQPEQTTRVQDILQYLDKYLHPIVSPEHWSVYSELYDMVSMLPPVQPEIIYCRNCEHQIQYFYEDKRRKDGGYYIYGCELPNDYSHVCFDDDFCSRAAERREE